MNTRCQCTQGIVNPYGVPEVKKASAHCPGKGEWRRGGLLNGGKDHFHGFDLRLFRHHVKQHGTQHGVGEEKNLIFPEGRKIKLNSRIKDILLWCRKLYRDYQVFLKKKKKYKKHRGGSMRATILP